MLIKARVTGIFVLKSELLKCSSISLAPLSNFSKFEGPIERAIERPTELQRENLPPTQSFIGKIFFGSIPKSITAFILEETATKCFGISILDE